MRVGFLMDPLERLQRGHDTTLALVEESCRRTHQTWVFEQGGLSVEDFQVTAQARRVRGPPLEAGAPERLSLDHLDVLFLRKDPPVDVEFLHATQMVELVRGSRRPLYINAPMGLRGANEKLFALRFPELVPRTLVSSDVTSLRTFVQANERTVLKPLDGFGGRGVFVTSARDENLRSLLELNTARGMQTIVAQAFLPEAREGDKRILLLDGEPIGAVLRTPSSDDFRGNLAAGARAVRTTLTPRDREICRTLAPELRTHGLFFVGIDVIGDFLTEINVTSPTGLLEVNALENVRLEERILDFAEKRAGG
jgi:glutathione synthase